MSSDNYWLVDYDKNTDEYVVFLCHGGENKLHVHSLHYYFHAKNAVDIFDFTSSSKDVMHTHWSEKATREFERKGI